MFEYREADADLQFVVNSTGIAARVIITRFKKYLNDYHEYPDLCDPFLSKQAHPMVLELVISNEETF